MSILITPREAWTAYFSMQTRAWELGIGAAVALAAPTLRRLTELPARLLTWVGLAAIVASMFVFDDNTQWPGYYALVPTLGAALVIGCGIRAPRAGAETVLRVAPLQFTGRVSYGWYLWHWPVIIIVPQMFGRPFNSAEKLVLALIALALAWAMFVLLEQPLLRMRLRPWVWIPAALVASGTTAIICLALIAVPSFRITGPPVGHTTLAGADAASELRTDLVAATTAEVLPRDVSPTPQTAPSAGRNPCLVQYFAVRQRTCATGDTAANRTVVLIGDSHADQWYAGLKVTAATEGWRLVTWAKVGCPIVANYEVYNPQIRRNYTECLQWRNERLKALSALRPALVVLSQDDILSPETYTAAQWGEQSAATVRKIAAIGSSVVFLGDTPHPYQSIPECVAEHLRSVSDCNFADPTRRGSGSPNAIQAQRRIDVARDVTAAGATYVDVAPWFCVDGTCPAVVGNVLMYRDDNHISSQAAKLMEPLLAEHVLGGR